MKRIFASLLLMIFMAPVAANALTLDISAAAAAKAIQGEWKLLSFQRHGEQAVRYEDRNIVWRFDERRLSVLPDDLGAFLFCLSLSLFRSTSTRNWLAS